MILSLWVALGGAIGSLARHWLSVAGAALLGRRFPWATLGINAGGSLLIGYAAARPGLPPAARTVVMVGVCGGFTTFSSFSLQTFDLIRNGRTLSAASYIAGSVLLCLAAVALGVMI